MGRQLHYLDVFGWIIMDTLEIRKYIDTWRSFLVSQGIPFSPEESEDYPDDEIVDMIEVIASKLPALDDTTVIFTHSYVAGDDSKAVLLFGYKPEVQDVLGTKWWDQTVIYDTTTIPKESFVVAHDELFPSSDPKFIVSTFFA